MICDLIRLVKASNPERSFDDIRRRLMKAGEEIGEVSDAYLGATSASNYKKRTWEDFREESVDTLIVLIDIALTEWPKVNYPPASLVPNIIKDAANTHYKHHGQFINDYFDAVRAIGKAEAFLMDDKALSFFGEISNALGAASKLCFAIFPEDHDEEIIHDRVKTLFTKKVAKWMSIKNNRKIEVLA